MLERITHYDDHDNKKFQHFIVWISHRNEHKRATFSFFNKSIFGNVFQLLSLSYPWSAFLEVAINQVCLNCLRLFSQKVNRNLFHGKQGSGSSRVIKSRIDSHGFTFHFYTIIRSQSYANQELKRFRQRLN